MYNLSQISNQTVSVNNSKNNSNPLNNKSTITLGKDVIENVADAEIGKNIIDQLRTSYTIGTISAPNIGPAGTLEVAVDTTSAGTIAIKNVARITGGVVAVGQTLYDVYTDYNTFGGLTKNFATATTIDVVKTVILGIGAGAAVSAGIPVIMVAIGGGVVVYLVDERIVSPLKQSLEH